MRKITQQLFYKLLFTTTLCYSIFNSNAQSNNTIANATKITNLPFTDSNVNIPNSNPNNANGLTGCNLTNKSVVYKFTPVTTGTITVEIKSTSGTTGTITTIASNENATQTSDLSPTPDGNICASTNPKTVNVNAGQTYYFLILNASQTDIQFTGTAILSLVTPSITTVNISSITKTSASFGGNITSNNGNPITERGIIYSSSDTKPEIGDTGVIKEIEGNTGTGSFSKTVTGLTKNTMYYYRAYAINSEGTGYGDIKSFTTLSDPPKITSITRHNPTNATTSNSTVIFKVTFDNNVKNVDVTDFELDSTVGGNINSVTKNSNTEYLVEITGLNNGVGTIGLNLKGVDGSGTNNIIGFTSNESTTITQNNTNDYLNHSEIGQTFKATTNGKLSAIAIYKKSSNHSFVGTADLKIFSGDKNASGVQIGNTQSININSTAGEQKITLTSSLNITAGGTYSFTLNNFVGTGNHALEANTTVTYTDGHVIFAGQNGNHDDFDLRFKIFESTETDGASLINTLPTTDETYTKKLNHDVLFDFDSNLSGYDTKTITQTVGDNVFEITSKDTNINTAGNLAGFYVDNGGFGGDEALNLGYPETEFTVKLQSGRAFSLVSFKTKTFSVKTLKVESSKGFVNFTTINSNGANTNSKFTSSDYPNSYFNNITSFTVSSDNLNGLPLDDFILEIEPFVALTTTDANTITKNSVVVGGNIISDMGSAITERGIIYSSSDNTPRIGEPGVTKEIEGGTVTGVFSQTATKLKRNTTYYYRAYAINSLGTGYGSIKSFKTLKELPTITTTDASNITATTANLGGEILSDGESTITEKGILYSTTNTSPRITDSSGTIKVVDTDAGTSFSESINGLNTSNTYYYRVYATNNQGTSYGSVKRFTLNNALNFDGTDDRITIADNVAFDFSGGFTAEAWVNPDIYGVQTYLSQYNTNQESFAFVLLNSGRIEFTITTDGSTDEYFESTIGVGTGKWSHVALTYDGSTMRAYINGVAAGTKSLSGTMFNSTAPIEIGARNNAHFFNGNIDEVRIWTRVLSETEINNGMNAQIPNNANGLTAYYKMNQGVAEGNNSGVTTLTDSSQNNLSGTLNNFSKTGNTSNFVTGANGVSGQTNYAANRFTSTGNWSSTNKWSHGAAPNTKQNATIANGVTITIDVDDLQLNDFTLETGATINIPKNKEITINGALNTSGNLDLSSDGSDSGVLFLKGTNTGNITYKRGGLLANKWSIITPPVSGQKIKAFADLAANSIRRNNTVTPNRYAIAYYDDSQSAGNKWVYYDVDMDANLEFEAGKSYAISRTTDGEVSFTGTLNTDNLFKTLTSNHWAAIGNPFTTYFPANKNSNNSFLSDNLSALDDLYQSIYMWDNSQNKYVAITELDATARSLTPGQGFFIKLKNGQTDIAFKEEKRSTKPTSGNTNFEKIKNTNPSLDIYASNDTHKVKTSIKYFSNASVGFDKGLDIGNFNSQNLDIYSKLLDGSKNTNFTIQSLPKEHLENFSIPIGINTGNNSEIYLSVSKKNIPNSYYVYIEDKKDNSFHRLDASSTTYKVNVTKNTKVDNRFYVHLMSKVLTTDDISLNNIKVYLSDKRTLTVNGLNSEKLSIKLISILGKEVHSSTSNTNKIDLPKSLKSGLYIIKIESNKASLTKKIILE